VGDVVADGDVRAADDPFELERRTARTRAWVQADRHLCDLPHAIVSRALERIEEPPRLWAVCGDEPAALEPQLDRARQLVRAEEEEGGVDDDGAVHGALDRACADLDVRRRSVASALARDPPERPAPPPLEAAPQ